MNTAFELYCELQTERIRQQLARHREPAIPPLRAKAVPSEAEKVRDAQQWLAHDRMCYFSAPQNRPARQYVLKSSYRQGDGHAA